MNFFSSRKSSFKEAVKTLSNHIEDQVVNCSRLFFEVLQIFKLYFSQNLESALKNATHYWNMRNVNGKNVLDWKKKHSLDFINNVGVRKQDQLGKVLQLGNFIVLFLFHFLSYIFQNRSILFYAYEW